MYEAPDRYKRMIAARLPDGESAGFARDSGSESSPLKDAQLIARGQLAPFLALTNIAAALLFCAALWGATQATWLVGWLVAVAGLNVLAMRWSQKIGRAHV